MTERPLCVITGSSSGIGAATAHRYAREGWDLVVNYSRDATAAEAVARSCRDLGATVLVVHADVASDADCRALAAQVQATFGRCDVLVNNAGTTKFVDLKDFDGLEAADFHRIYDVNVIGAFQMSRALRALLLAAPAGAIVNVSSIAAHMGSGSSLAYIASKGALNAMTIGLARALAPTVRVNAIAPGMVETPWLQNGLGPERYAQNVQLYKARAALDAVISADDVADAAWWLGVGARKTTGEVLVVDAGVRITRA